MPFSRTARILEPYGRAYERLALKEKAHSLDEIDDDFDADTLGAKWTVVNGSSGTVDLLEDTASVARYDLSTRPGWLLLQSGLGSGTAANPIELRQDAILADDTSVVVKWSPSKLFHTTRIADEFYAGIALNNNDTGWDSGTRVALMYRADTTDATLRYESGAGTIGDVGDVDAACGFGGTLYLRITRYAQSFFKKYTAFFSMDGNAWNPLGEYKTTTEMNNIWLFVDSGTNEIQDPVPIHAVDWIRQGGIGVDPW